MKECRENPILHQNFGFLHLYMLTRFGLSRTCQVLAVSGEITIRLAESMSTQYLFDWHRGFHGFRSVLSKTN